MVITADCLSAYGSSILPRVASFCCEEIKMNIGNMVGKVFTSVTQDGYEMVFANETERFRFFHYQDCCESVHVEDIVGDLSDLVGEPMLMAEEVSGEAPVGFDEEYHDVVEWTFYKFATRKGYVDVRWLGESNGYYSTSVSLEHELV
jgi:hypothetical protein